MKHSHTTIQDKRLVEEVLVREPSSYAVVGSVDDADDKNNNGILGTATNSNNKSSNNKSNKIDNNNYEEDTKKENSVLLSGVSSDNRRGISSLEEKQAIANRRKKEVNDSSNSCITGQANLIVPNASASSADNNKSNNNNNNNNSNSSNNGAGILAEKQALANRGRREQPKYSNNKSSINNKNNISNENNNSIKNNNNNDDNDDDDGNKNQGQGILAEKKALADRRNRTATNATSNQSQMPTTTAAAATTTEAPEEPITARRSPQNATSAGIEGDTHTVHQSYLVQAELVQQDTAVITEQEREQIEYETRERIMKEVIDAEAVIVADVDRPGNAPGNSTRSCTTRMFAILCLFLCLIMIIVVIVAITPLTRSGTNTNPFNTTLIPSSPNKPQDVSPDPMPVTQKPLPSNNTQNLTQISSSSNETTNVTQLPLSSNEMQDVTQIPLPSNKTQDTSPLFSTLGPTRTQSPSTASTSDNSEMFNNSFCEEAHPLFLDDNHTLIESLANAVYQEVNLDCRWGMAYMEQGLWYTFVGTGDPVTVTTCTPHTTETVSIQVTTGGCDFYSRVQCLRNELYNTHDCVDGGTTEIARSVSWTSVRGTHYYVLITRQLEAQSVGDIIGVKMVSNHQCENAFGPVPANGATLLGSTSTQQDHVGNNVRGCVHVTAAVTSGAWFRVVGTGNLLRASTCSGTSFDSQISIFQGISCSPDDLECVAGNDDACGLQSQVVWSSEVGITYYILVHEKANNNNNVDGGTTSQTFALQISDPVASQFVTNDICAAAVPLTVTTTPTTILVPLSSATNDPNAPICMGIYNGKERRGIWYTVVGTGAIMDASVISDGYDADLAVYDGTCDQLNCRDWSWQSEDMVTYYLFVRTMEDATIEGDVYLSVSTENPIR